jgi:hypothetical protein
MVKDSISLHSDYDNLDVLILTTWIITNLDAEYDIFKDDDTYGIVVLEITPQQTSELLQFEKEFREQYKE